MNHEIISRAEAKARGLRYYFTGKPCKRGGTAPRKSANGDCQCEACLAAFKQHSKAWEKANPDKHRDAATRRTRRWAEKNVGRVREAGRRWREQKRDAVNAHTMNRRARRNAATPPWFGDLDALVALEAADLAQRREAVTGFQWHVDHMIPLKARKACGLHCAANLQVIPASLNLRKLNRLELTKPGEWIMAA